MTPNNLSPSSAHGEARESDAEKRLRSKLSELCMTAVAIAEGQEGEGALQAQTDDLVEWLAAQRLSAKAEISEAAVEAAQNVFAMHGRYINADITRAALAAALSGEEE